MGNKAQLFGLRRITLRLRDLVRSKIRYRLLLLSAIPIGITLVGLIAITLYWTITYTWQKALEDVEERINFASSLISRDNQLVAQRVTHIGDAVQFHHLLKQVGHTAHPHSMQLIEHWLNKRASEIEVDAIRWIPARSPLSAPLAAYAQYEHAFFTVLDLADLALFNPVMAERARLTAINSGQLFQRVLVQRTVQPVSYLGQNLGFLDAIRIINNDAQYVDQLQSLLYPINSSHYPRSGVVTLFLENLRVTTNVPVSDARPLQRAIGSYAADNVTEQVLTEGSHYFDIAWVYNQWYVSAYQPIVDPEGVRIGMLFTGYQAWPVIHSYLVNLAEITIMVLAVMLISGVAVYRLARRLFVPIEQIAAVVKSVKRGDESRRIGQLKHRSGDEISVLAGQFDVMLDRLEQRKQRIQSDAALLENKVAERTAKLKEKTELLELHIRLLNDTRDKLLVNEKLAAIGQLSAGIAHEINNPVAVILGNIELIRADLLDGNSDVDAEIEVILEQIDRVRAITHSLLQYSRGDNALSDLVSESVNDAIAESITLVKTATKRTAVTFELDLRSTTAVELNKNHLLQVLVNLEVNAINALGNKGTVMVRSADRIVAGEVVGASIQVEDNGCGIAHEHIRQIFDPFFTTKRDGTGLGLSVSQSLLSQIGATLTVKSQQGQGTVFTIELNKFASPPES